MRLPFLKNLFSQRVLEIETSLKIPLIPMQTITASFQEEIRKRRKSDEKFCLKLLPSFYMNIYQQNLIVWVKIKILKLRSNYRLKY